MIGSSILILFLVSQASVHESIADNRQQANQEQPMPSANGQVDDMDQLGLRTLVPSLTQIRALDSLAMNRDDDHSNIELDKLMNEANRYEIVPVAAMYGTNHEGDAYSLARLFSKMMSLNRASEFVKNQMERKRSVRQSATTKEDKDYSFVGAPTLNKYSINNQQQRANSKWAAQKLRDMILSNGPTFRFATDSSSSTNNNNNLDQLSQVNLREFGDSNNANAIMPKNREKRRRCKVDPNLGVKNPSFCDTDAYFGAADYSMRDVWDSAGRRR